MKIALIAPIENTVPPKDYGGTEWIVYYLAHHLGKRGHKIDLFATEDSPVEPYYRIVHFNYKSLSSLPKIFENPISRERINNERIIKVFGYLFENNYDIIHNHGWRILWFTDILKKNINVYKMVTTHHGPLNTDLKYVFLNNKNLPHISISNNQRKDLPQLNYVATIYNGINLNFFPKYEENQTIKDNLVFLGRCVEEKGIKEAIQVALKIKKKLVLIAFVDPISTTTYFQVKSFFDGKNIIHYNSLPPEPRWQIISSSKALLMPIKWEEPFGLMFIESMACGTPVVAFARGSVPEVIKDGETGFIVNPSDDDIRGDFIIKKTGIEGLCEAVERIYSMPEDQYRKMRKACREHVEKNFTVEKMVDAYEKVYKEILNKKTS
jgi:glycosyltransferase involved in cell wall biosynthesis